MVIWPLLGRLGCGLFFRDEDFRDDADEGLKPVAASHRAIGKSDAAVRVDGRSALTIHGNAAKERPDLRFLIERDLFLADPVFDVGPAEHPLVEGADRGEVAV